MRRPAARRPAEDPEHPAHVGKRLAGGGVDRLDRRPDIGRPLVQRSLGGAGLDDDHADVVGDDVVELARDPLALLGDGLPVAFLALALEPAGPVLGRPELATAVARPRSRGPRRRGSPAPSGRGR